MKAQLQEEEIRIWTEQKEDFVKDEKGDSKDDGVSETSNDMFEEAVEQLRSYSFILIGASGRTFEMHSLVQKWLEMHREEKRWKTQF